MIDHRGAVNTILDINQRFDVQPDDRVLALSSLGFDLSVYDIFGTLAAGGTIVMPQADGLRDPSHWADLILRERVTIWNSAPALMTMLMEYMKDRAASTLESLRLVLLSGDWIPVGLPEQIRSFAPNARVISLGGATEASIWSILYPIEQIDPAWKSIPYGKPMLNQRMHVFNDAMEPCPVWVPGQLYIAGIGLAVGYWRDEEKTNASFVIHPATGERLYRTGDLGRYLPDGNIEFLGREDSQVKIRGYRIELGEIEATLCQHPTVGAAIVQPEGEERANRRLIAYVVPDGNGMPNGTELRQFLEAKLPEYMVPAAFVVLKELPVNINGKVDTKRLPTPASVQLDGETNYIAPRTNTERSIAGVWQEVLSLVRVSMDHSFFELGGDSAMMIRVQNKLTTVLQKDVPISALFTHTTVPALAAFLDQRQGGTTVFQQIDVRAVRQQEAMKRQKQRFQERKQGA
jgi:acyl-coenzyme A synthetase/AMP-(fatty) acid ligase